MNRTAKLNALVLLIIIAIMIAFAWRLNQSHHMTIFQSHDSPVLVKLAKPEEVLLAQGQHKEPLQVTAIPKAALHHTDRGNYFVLTLRHNKASRLPVTIGRDVHDKVIITHGITLGTPLIVSAEHPIRAGSLIRT